LIAATIGGTDQHHIGLSGKEKKGRRRSRRLPEPLPEPPELEEVPFGSSASRRSLPPFLYTVTTMRCHA
jgi:hypothetical protein